RPLALDRVQSSRAQAGEIRLRLSGRWVQGHSPAGEDEELLVINVEGRRHRFAPDPGEEHDSGLPPDRWSAIFTVPGWAEPREGGRAGLGLGTAVTRVPPLRAALGAPVAPMPAPPGPVLVDAPLAPPPAGRHLPPEGELPGSKQPDASRSGPLADLLLKETVAA